MLCIWDTGIFLNYLPLPILSGSNRISRRGIELETVRNSIPFGKKIRRVVYYLHRLKQMARMGNSFPSQIFTSFVFLCNVVYMINAVVLTYHNHTRCFRSTVEHKDLVVELGVTLVLCVFFIVRLLASDHIVRFWKKLFLTSFCFFLYLRQDWPVIRALRMVWLTQLSAVLRFPPLCKSQGANEALRIITRVYNTFPDHRFNAKDLERARLSECLEVFIRRMATLAFSCP